MKKEPSLLKVGGRHITVVALSLHVPTSPGLIPSIPEIFKEKYSMSLGFNDSCTA